MYIFNLISVKTSYCYPQPSLAALSYVTSRLISCFEANKKKKSRCHCSVLFFKKYPVSIQFPSLGLPTCKWLNHFCPAACAVSQKTKKPVKSNKCVRMNSIKYDVLLETQDLYQHKSRILQITHSQFLEH